jgi:hypothetical protein
MVQKMADNNEQRLVHVCELGAPSPSGSCVSHRVVAEEGGREQTAVWAMNRHVPDSNWLSSMFPVFFRGL